MRSRGSLWVSQASQSDLVVLQPQLASPSIYVAESHDDLRQQAHAIDLPDAQRQCHEIHKYVDSLDHPHLTPRPWRLVLGEDLIRL